MQSLSGVRIFLASVAVCAVLGLSLVLHHGANGAVTTPVPARPSAAPSARPQPGLAAEQATEPPEGFTSFRMRNPAEVSDSPAAFATVAQVELAEKVNDEINHQIDWHETRLWSVELGPHAHGDCVQYAVTKRHVLDQHGVPDGALRLMVVYAAKYHGLHIVLEMRSPTNIYVLDSLENDARHHFYTVAQMPRSYSVVKYQTWGKPTRWVAPASLVAENTSATRRLHDEVAAAGSDPWVHSPVAPAHGLHRATASREPRR